MITCVIEFGKEKQLMIMKTIKTRLYYEKATAFCREMVFAAGVFLLFITFVMQSYAVEGGSMQPTLESGERLIAEKLSYRFGSIEQGDIVVLYYPADTSKTFVKRVIARPGDVIEIKNGVPQINGSALPEDYVTQSFRSHDFIKPVHIPAGYYFVMGDHRNVSFDSRHFGLVPEKYILGRAVLRFWPLTRINLFS